MKNILIKEIGNKIEVYFEINLINNIWGHGGINVY